MAVFLTFLKESNRKEKMCNHEIRHPAIKILKKNGSSRQEVNGHVLLKTRSRLTGVTLWSEVVVSGEVVWDWVNFSPVTF